MLYNQRNRHCSVRTPRVVQPTFVAQLCDVMTNDMHARFVAQLCDAMTNDMHARFVAQLCDMVTNDMHARHVSSYVTW